MIGVTKINCTNNDAPATALSLKGYVSTWIISGNSVYYDGLKVNLFHNKIQINNKKIYFFRLKVIMAQI